jgi:hypothetical protein
MSRDDVRRGLSAMTLPELKSMVRKYNATVAIQKYSKMKKAELIEEMLKKGVVEILRTAPEIKKKLTTTAPKKQKVKVEIEEEEEEKPKKRKPVSRPPAQAKKDCEEGKRDCDVCEARFGEEVGTKCRRAKKPPPAKKPATAPKKSGPATKRLTDQERRKLLSEDEQIKELEKELAKLEERREELKKAPPKKEPRKKVLATPPEEKRLEMKKVRDSLTTTFNDPRSAMNASTNPAGLARAIRAFRKKVEKLEELDRPFNVNQDSIALYRRFLKKAERRLVDISEI